MTQTTNDRRCTCVTCGAHASSARSLILTACGWLCPRCAAHGDD